MRSAHLILSRRHARGILRIGDGDQAFDRHGARIDLQHRVRQMLPIGDEHHGGTLLRQGTRGTCLPGGGNNAQIRADDLRIARHERRQKHSRAVGGETVDTHTFNSSTMNSDYSAVLYEGQDYECIKDGAFEESTFRSAPYFDLRIDGINEL